jgi:threonyl-tRNA synthetase
VRGFTQDDAHIFCRPDQVKDEFKAVIDIVLRIFNALDFKDFITQISLRDPNNPDKYIGSDENWDKAEKAIIEVAQEKGLEYTIEEGEAAFYGPKMDFMVRDAIGRKWQLGTIQVDYNLPERFELEYNGENNEKIQPVMIHRAILGSFERFIGILTEHYAGEFPMFIAPTQVAIVPVAESHKEYAKIISDKLIDIGADSEIYAKNDSLNKRIRTAEKTRVPMIIVIGDEEIQHKSIAVRDRRTREQYNLSEDDFLSLIQTKINEVNF